MKKIYKVWFRPEIATALAERYSHISLNELLALQEPSPKIRDIWESTSLRWQLEQVGSAGSGAKKTVLGQVGLSQRFFNAITLLYCRFQILGSVIHPRPCAVKLNCKKS